MYKWINNTKSEKGSILVFATAAMLAFMILTSLAIDVSSILTARNQLQCAVDASALAGAAGLIYGNGRAISQAQDIGSSNRCLNQSVEICSTDVTIICSRRIRVDADHTVPLHFAKVIGLNSADISASAIAELANIRGTKGLKPWAIPKKTWQSGQIVTLKAGSLGAPSTNPSFYYCIDFPPVNRGTPISGASEYRQNIIYGCQSNVFKDDIIQVEPGNMIGPTQQGVQDLISQDPNAYWDGTEVRNSNFPGFGSPRIIKIPLYDPNNPPYSGRNTIDVVGLASFFLVGFQGKDIIGVYMQSTTGGKYGGVHGFSFLMGSHLIQ